MKYTSAVIVLLFILGCLVHLTPAARSSPLAADITFSNVDQSYKSPSFASNVVFSGATRNTGLGVYMTSADDICVTEFVLFVKANSADAEEVQATPIIYSTADSSDPVFTGEAIALPNTIDYTAIKIKVEPCFRMEYGVSAVFGLNIAAKTSKKSFTMKTVTRELASNVATVATISNHGVSLVSGETSVDFAIIQHASGLHQPRFVEMVEEVEDVEATVPPVGPTADPDTEPTNAPTEGASTTQAATLSPVTEAPDVGTTAEGTTAEGTTAAPTTTEQVTTTPQQDTTTTTKQATTPSGSDDSDDSDSEDDTSTTQSATTTDAPTTTTTTTAAPTTTTTTVAQSTTAAPLVPAVFAATFVQTIGGVTTITGQNFGSSSTAIIVSINNQPCTDVAINTADTSISCYVGAGTGKNKRVSVSVNGVSNVDTNSAFSRSAPTVSGISLSGSTVAISGNNFGSNAAVVAVSAGSISCPVVSATHTVVTCTVPSGVNLQSASSAGQITVSLSVDGQAISATLRLDITDSNSSQGEGVSAATSTHSQILSLSLAAILVFTSLFC